MSLNQPALTAPLVDTTPKPTSTSTNPSTLFPSPTHPSLASLPPDNELRKLYPKDTFANPQAVRLPLGETTYWLIGPESGRKVVLIHGISTPAVAFKELAPILVKSGFRVLIYDLYGRGYTEAPADPTLTYDANLYITQLALLIQHVEFNKAAIVGYSMGGGIAAAFAATFPNLVDGKVVFIAAAGLMDPLPAGVSYPPAESFEGGKVPITALSVSFRTPYSRLQLEYLPGYYRALTSSIVSGPLRKLNRAFEMIAAQKNVKVLIIHGNNDTVVKLECGQRIKDIITSAEFVIVDGAGHDFPVSHQNIGFNELVDSLMKFLSS